MIRRSLLFFIILLSSATASAQQKESIAVDSYIHVGVISNSSGDRQDEMRMLSLGSVGVSYFITRQFAIRASAGSLIGLIIPSLEAGLGAEYAFFDAPVSPFVRIAGRGILNVGIECANEGASCADAAERRRENRPADAFGPLGAGVLGEIGGGVRLRFSDILISAWGAYQGGPAVLNPPNGENQLLRGYYDGWLGNVSVGVFIK